MKKKFLSVILAAAMAASLAACGSSSNGNASETAASEAATSEAAAPAGAAGGTFKIGAIGPLTGGAAIYGNAVINGAQIAVDEINALGGDIQFELKAEDDVHDAETSVNAYNNLMDWGMQALVGTTTTAPCVAVSAETNKDRVFQITPSASSTAVVEGKDNVFQVCFTDPNQGSASADYISENMADNKIAVIYKNDDAYSQGIHDTFVAKAGENNLEVVYEGTFTDDTATDFSVQLTAAQSAGATLVFLPIYYQPASIILAQADAMGFAPIWFGVDGMDGILTMEGFDTNLAEGVMLLTPFSADAEDERTQNFVKTYTEKYKDTPNQFAADSYDAVYTVYAAIQEAGCTADMDAAAICEALIPVMTKISVDGLTGEAMTWAATGEVSKAPRAVVIKEGVYVTP
ncbi:MAG: ABC transporter substrate-binding protein [Eubacteriales bacterium]|nr:ABC transporter substrate-binding protein [Eubacteriales bacterium]